MLEETGADDVIYLGALDGRARILDPPQDVLQLGKSQLGVILGQDLQILQPAGGDRSDQHAVIHGVHGLGQLTKKAQGL